MAQNPTSKKVNERARTVLANLLFTEVSDPRLRMLTVTRVMVNRERSIADIYISTDPSRYAEAMEGLESAKGRLRSLLGQELGWKLTPELRFQIDPGLDHALAIDEVLKNPPQTLISEDTQESAQADENTEAAKGE